MIGPLAQLVEQWTLNPFVEGSTPSRPTISLVVSVSYTFLWLFKCVLQPIQAACKAIYTHQNTLNALRDSIRIKMCSILFSV